MSPEVFGSVAALLSPQQMVELTAVIGTYNMVSRFLAAMDLSGAETMPGHDEGMSMNIGTESAAELDVRDQLQIRTLIAQVCRALDLSRPADFVAAFTPDGVYRIVSPDFDGRQERYSHHGADSLLAFAKGMAAKRKGMARHWTGNPIIEADGNGGATAWSYTMLVEIDPETKARKILLTGVHEDVFVRTAAGWRLASRTVVADV